MVYEHSISEWNFPNKNHPKYPWQNEYYARQGKEQIPTIHLGVAAHQMEQKGIATDRGNMNRAIRLTNLHLQKLRSQILQLQNELRKELERPSPSPLADKVQEVLKRQKQGQYGGNHNPKTIESMMTFLRENEIERLADLEETTR